MVEVGVVVGVEGDANGDGEVLAGGEGAARMVPPFFLQGMYTMKKTSTMTSDALLGCRRYEVMPAAPTGESTNERRQLAVQCRLRHSPALRSPARRQRFQRPGSGVAAGSAAKEWSRGRMARRLNGGVNQ